MVRTITIYAVILAIGAFILEWLHYKYTVRAFASEIYITTIAVSFITLGIWIGFRLSPKSVKTDFEQNHQAITTLGISPRELDVLTQLAAGHSNKEIARRLSVSPNTVKSHTVKLYEKLSVSGRVQAIQKAQELSITA